MTPSPTDPSAQQVIEAAICDHEIHPDCYCNEDASLAVAALDAAGYPLPPGEPRYGQCDDTCTVDCGHCKGAGPPGEPDDGVPRGGKALAPMDPEAGGKLPEWLLETLAYLRWSIKQPIPYSVATIWSMVPSEIRALLAEPPTTEGAS